MGFRQYKVVLLIQFLWCILALTAAQECTTPNGATATCISLYSCPTLIGALATFNNSSIEFVRQSQCNSCSVLVCCGSDIDFSPSTYYPTSRPSTSARPGIPTPRPLLPPAKYCGLQHTDDRIYNETETALDEFPWLALIKIRNAQTKEDVGFHCAGTLISNRYVLTAAQCLTSENYEPTTVRLGEYNMERVIECVNNTGVPNAPDDCNDPPLDVAIEEYIIHEDFDRDNVTAGNDIALIRLKAGISYTDFIRPICMPLPGTNLAEPGDILYATGFAKGEFEIGQNSSWLDRKKRIKVELSSENDCRAAYIPGVKNLTNILMCGTEYDESNCMGDAGSPLMSVTKRYHWHQEGIVSYINNPCGKNSTVVFTRVAAYVDWIQSKLRR